MTVQEPQKHSRESISRRLAELPRVELAVLPTPLQDCPRLSEALGGPRILVKRDDMTGLAFGGNKTRRLEFVMGDALEKGADLIIAGAPLQSNHCRQTAAAANKLGMKAVLVLFGKIEGQLQGNLLLDDILGADIVNVEEADLYSVRQFFYEQEEAYRKKGYTPYVLDTLGPSGRFGVLAYVDCAVELSAQLEEQGIAATHIVTAVGSGGTLAGLALGAKLLGADYQAYGISIRKDREELRRFTTRESREAAEALGLDVSLSPEDVLIDDAHRGPGYGIVTDREREAIRLAARTEALMFDGTYMGKVMAGLIDLVHQGRFGPRDTIVLLHTGGTPIIFAENLDLASGVSIHTATASSP
jgi:D-cysteine desulfhydrase family pyridoxal phosphate-dependent enzyme